jgi:hypothetical protein
MPLLQTQSARGYGFSTRIPISANHVELGNITVGSGGAADVTFSSISQNYDHLEIFWNARTNFAGTNDFVNVIFNSDTTANYNFDYLDGTTATSTISGAVSTKSGNNNAWLTMITGANNTSGIFGVGNGLIADYSKTNRNKSMHTYGGFDDGLAGTPFGNTRIENSVWFSTNAITSILIKPYSGTLFAQHTNFTLYGIKGA